MNVGVLRGDVLILNDGREVRVTDLPEYDRDLAVVETGTGLETINAFQVAWNKTEVEFASLDSELSQDYTR